MKELVGAFNQEKALEVEGAFSVIVKLCVIFGNIRFKLYPLLTSPWCGCLPSAVYSGRR